MPRERPQRRRTIVVEEDDTDKDVCYYSKVSYDLEDDEPDTRRRTQIKTGDLGVELDELEKQMDLRIRFLDGESDAGTADQGSGGCKCKGKCGGCSSEVKEEEEVIETYKLKEKTKEKHKFKVPLPSPRRRRGKPAPPVDYYESECTVESESEVEAHIHRRVKKSVRYADELEMAGAGARPSPRPRARAPAPAPPVIVAPPRKPSYSTRRVRYAIPLPPPTPPAATPAHRRRQGRRVDTDAPDWKKREKDLAARAQRVEGALQRVSTRLEARERDLLMREEESWRRWRHAEQRITTYA